MDRKERPMKSNDEEVATRHGITRRQLLQMAPALAIPAALSAAAPAAARPIPPDYDPLAPTSSVSTATPSSRLGDIPLCPPELAIRECQIRRRRQESEIAWKPGALDKILGDTPLWESALGLANWVLLEEAEDLNLGHMTFPISPYSVTADDGEHRFPLLSNGHGIGNFRVGEFLETTHRRMFDRAAWAISQGAVVTASVELDRPISPEKAVGLLRLLGGYGVSTIIWGNEPNDPYTPWRDNIPSTFEAMSAADDARRKYGLQQVDISFPGLAYYGNGEYLEKMLRTAKELQQQRGPGDPAKNLPAQRVSDHFYGPVNQFLPRIRNMQDVMKREGAGHLKYDLTEVGNPTIGREDKAGDERLAGGLLPAGGIPRHRLRRGGPLLRLLAAGQHLGGLADRGA